jgi:hypothetical protein
MSIHVGVSGAHKEVTEVTVGVSGSWKLVTDGYVGVSGVWKNIFTTVELMDDSLTDYDLTGTAAHAVFQIDSDGDAKYSLSALADSGVLYEWYSGASPSSFEVRATLNSGALTYGTTGVWLTCGSDQSWEVAQAGVGSLTADLTIEIRSASSGSVLASGHIILNAVVTA